MIQSLNALRGLFAVMIFFHHSNWQGTGIFPAGGDCAVSFFLMLSGFVLVQGYYDKVQNSSIDVRKFLRHRIAKIYPLHLLTLVLAAILAWYEFGRIGVRPLMSNALLIQGWIPDSDYYFSYNGVSWFLSVLLFAYLIFPWVLRFATRRFTLFSLMLATYCILVIGVGFIIDPMYKKAFIYISPISRVADFLIGIWVGIIYLKGHKKGVISYLRSSGAQSVVIGLTTTVVLMLFYDFVAYELQLASCWWLPVGLLIYGAACLEDNKNHPLLKLLNNRMLVFMGSISFSFFMLHQLVIRYFKAFDFGMEKDWMILTCTFSISLILSAIIEILKKRQKVMSGL